MHKHHTNCPIYPVFIYSDIYPIYPNISSEFILPMQNRGCIWTMYDIYVQRTQGLILNHNTKKPNRHRISVEPEGFKEYS